MTKLRHVTEKSIGENESNEHRKYIRGSFSYKCVFYILGDFSLNNIYFIKFQHTIIQIYIYTYNVQWDSETSNKTYVNLSPYLDIDNISRQW